MLQHSQDIIEFTLVYNRHKSGLFYYVYRMLNNRPVSEDIIQNVFMKFYENMDIIKSKEVYASWLYTAARNEVYMHLRKQKRANITDMETDELPGDDLTKKMELREVKEMVESMLETVPVEHREVYLLKEYGGLSYREIGAMLGIGEDLVKSRLFKLRQKLIRYISKMILF